MGIEWEELSVLPARCLPATLSTLLPGKTCSAYIPCHGRLPQSLSPCPPPYTPAREDFFSPCLPAPLSTHLPGKSSSASIFLPSPILPCHRRLPQPLSPCPTSTLLPPQHPYQERLTLLSRRTFVSRATSPPFSSMTSREQACGHNTRRHEWLTHA